MITFEDLPSTKTPLNANNLNNNFKELQNQIPKKIKCNDEEDAINKSKGDTINEYYWIED